MPRLLANIRPTFIVRVGGEVDGQNVNDVAIEGLYMEVAFIPLVDGRNVFHPGVVTTVDILHGVDTFDANVIRLLENIQAALDTEPATALLVTDEVSDG
jgi:hypothetical protein